VPAVVLSGALEFASILDGSNGEHVGLGALAVATLLAFVVGYASIAFLLRFLASHSTIVFVAYRVVLGAIVLALVGAGAIE
jgi:undecaprenyl-diphosphatase